MLDTGSVTVNVISVVKDLYVNVTFLLSTSAFVLSTVISPVAIPLAIFNVSSNVFPDESLYVAVSCPPEKSIVSPCS